ncbi:MAG: ThiF family adenylyltransferase, partial [Gemmatimonadota bacterium]
MSRYARQEALEGWDQSRVASATVAIAGSGPTAFLAGLMATAMGFGRLVLVGRGARAGRDLSGLGDLVEASPGAWARLYERVNPEVELLVVKGGQPAGCGRLPDLDGFIAAGNEYGAVAQAERLGRDGQVAAVAGGAVRGMGTWGAPRADALAARMGRCPEDPLLAQVVAGLLVDELRKALLPLTSEAGRTARRHVFCLPRLGRDGDEIPGRPLRLRGTSVALVGAGALGTWFGLGLGLSGRRLRLHVYDGDVVEETNLNRQVLFYGAVGQPKATTLAARLSRLFPTLQVNGYGMLVRSETAALLRAAPVVAACPDSFGVRAFLNRLCCQRRQVLVNGGTSAMGGSCTAYAPGHTACLSCVMGIDRLAQQEVEAQGCGRADPSVVTSNAITGGVMAWAVSELFSERVPRGVWEYDGRARDQRLGVHSQRPACRCHHRG